MRQRDSGNARTLFTLIELLVVIAIIAILASMLLPALRRANFLILDGTVQGHRFGSINWNEFK